MPEEVTQGGLQATSYAERTEHALISGVHGKKVFVVDSDGNQINIARQDSQLTDDKVHILLQQIRDAIQMRPDYIEATNTQAISGTVAIAGMTGTNTITTLTNQTNIGGYTADMVMENNSFQDWGLSIRSLLI